jgi:hypothetical protein
MYNLYICGDCPTNDSQWKLEGEFESKPGDNLDQVHPDKMVLKIVKGETEPHEQLPKATQWGLSGSSPLTSDGFCDDQAGRLDA